MTRYLDSVDLQFEKKVERKALNKLFDMYWESEFDPAGSPLPPRTLATERRVNWQLTDRLFLRGYIDRIVELPDGGTEIIDYKTGAPHGGNDVRKSLGMPLAGAQATGEEITKDLQILIYLIAAREGGIDGLPDVRPEIVGLWYPKGKPRTAESSIRKVRILVDDKAVSGYKEKRDMIEMTSDELAEHKARIVSLAREVGVGAFPPVPRHDSYTCLTTWGNSGCDYAWICPGRIEEPDWYDPE